MNLYLKYRPKTIDELDLAGVRKTLLDIVAANNIGHAYLLTGPRGAGKTSTARVLARVVNCEKNGDKLGEPCNECAACLSIFNSSAMDVIEIDAASNRGIDDIRELKEKIRLAPAVLSRKVYIIDEVHMLTTEAFNALLKTLEEPPTHSLFILCTTELHKVPETIVSRCIQIQFTKATSEEMKRSFSRVVAGEGKTVSPDALDYLSKAVDGSFRDGVKILDQVLANSDKVELSDIEQVVSGSAGYKIGELVSALAEKNITKSLIKLNEAISEGVDSTYLLLNLMRGLRDLLVANKISLDVTKFIFSLDEVARRQATSLDGELLIQVAIIEWCGVELGSPTGLPKKPEKNDVVTQKPQPENVGMKSVESNDVVLEEVSKKDVPTDIAIEVIGTTLDSGDVWRQVLGSLGQNNLALDTILSKARPGNIHGDELTVFVQYDFHKQQLMSEKNLVKLESIISKAVGRPMKVRCEVGDKGAMSVAAPVPEAVDGRGDTIDEAMSIFTN